MTAIILFIGLFLMLGDVAYKLKKSPHRKISLILIATTMFYVAMDCLWIVEYTSEEFNRGYYVILNTTLLSGVYHHAVYLVPLC